MKPKYIKPAIAPEYYYRNFLHPRHWITWIGIFFLYLISWLPYDAKQKLGSLLGILMYKSGGNRLQITRTNINACFPELDNEQREVIIKESFIANMKGLIETTIAWWCNHEPLIDKLEVHGYEHMKEAERRGKGVLLIGGHFSILDLAGPMANSVFDFSYMYRPNSNPLFNAVIERSRTRYRHEKFNKFQIPEMNEYIKKGNTVWYGFDQDFGRRRSVFAPFFGVQTATIKMAASLTRSTQATVLMVSQFREGNGVYSVRFSPIFEGIAEDDDITAATRLNQQLEEFVRIHPEQYLWMHRRFNSRPEGEPPFYPKKKRKKSSSRSN
jgi:KDO2-lipid IV(A) lauroyltransferase